MLHFRSDQLDRSVWSICWLIPVIDPFDRLCSQSLRFPWLCSPLSATDRQLRTLSQPGPESVWAVFIVNNPNKLDFKPHLINEINQDYFIKITHRGKLRAQVMIKFYSNIRKVLLFRTETSLCCPLVANLPTRSWGDLKPQKLRRSPDLLQSSPPHRLSRAFW